MSSRLCIQKDWEIRVRSGNDVVFGEKVCCHIVLTKRRLENADNALFVKLSCGQDAVVPLK